jgi:hypothetical protein
VGYVPEPPEPVEPVLPEVPLVVLPEVDEVPEVVELVPEVPLLVLLDVLEEPELVELVPEVLELPPVVKCEPLCREFDLAAAGKQPARRISPRQRPTAFICLVLLRKWGTKLRR